jgi:3-phosphoshikimate 1-carboxyvinyltransferase
MATPGLPDVLEVEPLASVPAAEIILPGSKSITNRALVLAALADGECTIEGALWSDDTRVMCDALQRLGFTVSVQPAAGDPANRTITVIGQGGAIPRGGTADQPLELFVGNAGTAARFLVPFVALGRGVYRLSGTPRMAERPQSPLLGALRELGFRVDSANGRLPAVVHGGEPRSHRCRVSASESSQFASGLLLAGRAGGWSVEVTDADSEELPYVEMTRQMVSTFPHEGGRFQVEPDASSGSYFLAAAWLLSQEKAEDWRPRSPLQVEGWPESGWQVDERFPAFLPHPVEISRERHLGDSVMTAIVLAPWAEEPVRFVDLGRLRLQECERVLALRTELGKCGVDVREEGDTLTIFPGAPHGAEIETYDDHRMAMCFAVLGLAVPGMRIRDPGCVAKTFPNFWQKLAAPPPHGLGVVLRDARDGRRLATEALLRPDKGHFQE